ncbi:MAG: alpha/beta hydrolase [Candidatus Aminicenantes bacterium]|nr:alpha/beta hydrolase [Candidatus Aminicenantes bacterium]
MAPVANELSSVGGVLEPLQTADSIEGQIKELGNLLERSGNLPLSLIGFSWGALLAFIFAARFPSYVKKLILISSGVFEEKYAERIMDARLSRLTGGERIELNALIDILNDPASPDKDSGLARLGRLMSKADAYRPLPGGDENLEVRYNIYQSVWREAQDLRRSGRLLEIGREIRCPVVAIHGDHDPHPPDGVKIPLSGVLRDFRFILLKKCGHRPWLEQEARESFLKILKNELI